MLFVPDFVLNSGALIEGAGHERTGRLDWSPEIKQIGETVSRVLKRAESEGCSTVEAAVAMAQEILSKEAGEEAPAPAVLETS